VPGTDDVDTQPTLGFQRVIQRAIMHVQSTSNGKKEVTGANVLVAIFGEKDSHAVYYLQQQGVTRLDVVNFISHGIAKTNGGEAAKSTDGNAESEDANAQKETPLAQFTQNLNQLAKDGKIDPLIGRERRSSAWCRCCAAAARTIRCSSAKPASARRRSPKGSPGASRAARCRTFSRTRRCIRSTWARCWPAPSTAATSSSA
jgi:hypothetical protein